MMRHFLQKRHWSWPTGISNIANSPKMVGTIIRRINFTGTEIYELIGLIDAYLNGPRTLSNERLSYLIVSQSDGNLKGDQNIDFLICATHFLGDGMALHQFANDFFTLLGSTLSQENLATQLSVEWSERCSNIKNAVNMSYLVAQPDDS